MSEADARRHRLLQILGDRTGPRFHPRMARDALRSACFAISDDQFEEDVNELVDLGHVQVSAAPSPASGQDGAPGTPCDRCRAKSRPACVHLRWPWSAARLTLTRTGREIVDLEPRRPHWRCSADCGCGGAADEDGCCATCGADCAKCICGVSLDLGGGARLTLPPAAAMRPAAVSALHEAARALVAAVVVDEGSRLRGVRPPDPGAHLGATEAS